MERFAGENYMKHLRLTEYEAKWLRTILEWSKVAQDAILDVETDAKIRQDCEHAKRVCNQILEKLMRSLQENPT